MGGPAVRKRRKEEEKYNKEGNEAESGLMKLYKRTPSL